MTCAPAEPIVNIIIPKLASTLRHSGRSVAINLPTAPEDAVPPIGAPSPLAALPVAVAVSDTAIN